MNIWEIKQELLSIFDELEENGGELTEELEQQLAISQEDFRSKVEDYTNVIKSIKADIAAIDEETKRLTALKKSKNALIERLSKVIIDAVEMFGETTKAGGKFFDYGTGKISIRNSQAVEIDEDKVNAIVDEISAAISSEAIDKNTGIVLDNPKEVTKEDIANTIVEISFKQTIKDLLCGEGFNLIKEIFMYNNGTNISSKIDKNKIKTEIKGNSDISIAKLKTNKNLIIK